MTNELDFSLSQAVNDAVDRVNLPKYLDPKLEALAFFKDQGDCQDLTLSHEYFDALTGKYLGRYFHETEVNGTPERRHVFVIESEDMNHLKEEELATVLPVSRRIEFGLKVNEINRNRAQELADLDASIYSVATEVLLNAGRLFAQLLVRKVKSVFVHQGNIKGNVTYSKVEIVRDVRSSHRVNLDNLYISMLPGLKHTELTKGEYYRLYRDGKLVGNAINFDRVNPINRNSIIAVDGNQEDVIYLEDGDLFITPSEVNGARDKARKIAEQSFIILVTTLRQKYVENLRGK